MQQPYLQQPAQPPMQDVAQQQVYQQPQPGQQAGFQAVEQPMAMPPRSPPSPIQAAALIQRWYRGRLRRVRFLTVINRARRRRAYLDQRRRIAQRLYSNEVEAEEAKARLAQPGGARLVAARRDAQQADAAQRVQLLWRRTRAKRKLATLDRRQQEEKAIRMLQRCARRWRERRRRGTMQSLMARALQESPYGKPLSDERLLQNEQEILGKCRQFQASSRAGRSDEDWRKQAEAAYQEFTAEIGMHRSAVVRTLIQREQIKQITQALDGRSSFQNPLPYGVCNASLMGEALEKHRQRKASMVKDIRGLGDVSLSVESRAEEQEANASLRDLERLLGCDFSSLAERPAPASSVLDRLPLLLQR